MACLEAESQPQAENRNARPVRWTSEMIQLLFNGSETIKTLCEFEGTDFDADRTKQYEWLRGRYSKIRF